MVARNKRVRSSDQNVDDAKKRAKVGKLDNERGDQLDIDTTYYENVISECDATPGDGSIDISTASASGSPGISRDSASGCPDISRDSAYGSLDISFESAYGRPGISRDLAHGSLDITTDSAYGSPDISLESAHGSPGVSRDSAYGSLDIPRARDSAYGSLDTLRDAINDTGHDEIDGIVVMNSTCQAVDEADVDVDADGRYGTRIDVPGTGFWIFCAEPCESSTVYISHEDQTDSELGDRFGATCLTYKGTEFNRHLLTNIQPGSPADKMKIMNNDEIVLINHNFVPNMSHNDVIKIFHYIPVDGSKLVMVIRRKVERSDNWLQWFEFSAVLVSDTRTVSVRVDELSFAHMTRNVKTYTELNMYKIKDTENYLALWGSEVSVTPGCTSEHTKIWKTTTIKQHGPHSYIYNCTLSSNCNNRSYVTIANNAVKVQTSEPQPFQFQKNGGNISFVKDGVYLAFDQERITCSEARFFFEEYPGDLDIDHIVLGASVSSLDSIASDYNNALDEHRNRNINRRDTFTRSNTVGLSDPFNCVLNVTD